MGENNRVTPYTEPRERESEGLGKEKTEKEKDIDTGAYCHKEPSVAKRREEGGEVGRGKRS